MEEGKTHRRVEQAEAAKLAIGPDCFERRPSPCERGQDDLHVCPRCDSRFVYPLDWGQADAKHWRVRLRCPECEWRGDGVYAQPTLDRFDEELDRSTEEVLEDLKAIARVNLEDEIDRFAEALHAGQILPEDF